MQVDGKMCLIGGEVASFSLRTPFNPTLCQLYFLLSGPAMWYPPGLLLLFQALTLSLAGSLQRQSKDQQNEGNYEALQMRSSSKNPGSASHGAPCISTRVNPQHITLPTPFP